MKPSVANVAASVRQRLLNIARERKEDFNLVLTKYGLERVLYRISLSKYREIFVLKGALLFELWTKQRSGTRPREIEIAPQPCRRILVS